MRFIDNELYKSIPKLGGEVKFKLLEYIYPLFHVLRSKKKTFPRSIGILRELS